MSYVVPFLWPIKTKVVWFNVQKSPKVPSFSFLTLRQSIDLDIPEPYIISKTPFTTTYIDLRKDLVSIWNSMDKKSTQYEINRWKKFSNDIRIEITKDLNKVRDFLNIWEKYYEKKYGKPKKMSLDNVITKWQYTLFLAYFNDILICGHLFIYDTARVRLNYSFSNYLEDEDMRKKSTFLTKFLHWEAINYFKKQKFEIYDFWWIDLDENSLTYGITRFKLSFWWEIITEYDYLVSKIWKPIKKIVNNPFVKIFINKFPKLQRFLYG